MGFADFHVFQTTARHDVEQKIFYFCASKIRRCGT